jgi:hypothetical protein
VLRKTRNAAQAISPGALADELNNGWHLNVPSCRCSQAFLLRIVKQHSCQTTKSPALRAHAVHFA